MVKINKIYTKTGDDGTTGLVGGARLKKNSKRVSSYGEIDELNSWLGLIRTSAESENSSLILEIISEVQNELFDIGAELATPKGSEWPGMAKVSEKEILKLEKWIDKATEGIPELRSFVLPGGSPLNSYLHIARAVCRRAERTILIFNEEEKINPELIKYLNRLSDLLFALARYESNRSNIKEYLWKPGEKKD